MVFGKTIDREIRTPIQTATIIACIALVLAGLAIVVSVGGNRNGA